MKGIQAFALLAWQAFQQDFPRDFEPLVWAGYNGSEAKKAFIFTTPVKGADR